MIGDVVDRIHGLVGGDTRPRDLRVEVIGNDGIRRVGYCSKQDTMAFEKYQIHPDGVFLTEFQQEKGVPRYEPTILFHENSCSPVKKGAASPMTPQECSEAISTASFSMARLMYQQDQQSELLKLVLTAGALVCAAAAAYFAFSATGGVGEIQALLDQIVMYTPSITPPAIVTPVITPVITPTPIPTAVW